MTTKKSAASLQQVRLGGDGLRCALFTDMARLRQQCAPQADQL